MFSLYRGVFEPFLVLYVSQYSAVGGRRRCIANDKEPERERLIHTAASIGPKDKERDLTGSRGVPISSHRRVVLERYQESN